MDIRKVKYINSGAHQEKEVINRRVPQVPDFLRTLVGPSQFMRLSV
jgi:hypothetical protein